MDAAHQIAELGHRRVGSGPRLQQQPARAFDVAVEQVLGHAELQRQRDELGLRAVVEVALDPPQLQRRGVQGGGARLGEPLDAVAQPRSEQPARPPRLQPSPAAPASLSPSHSINPPTGIANTASARSSMTTHW